MTVFLKLGGSLITDKSQPETARTAEIERVAREIASALAAAPGLRLVIGHGSGSFGHVAAREYGTRRGVKDRAGWKGYAHVSTVAGRLNQIMLDALDLAGVPVLGVQPSASARCRDGEIVEMVIDPIRRGLDQGLVPLVYGDVALDDVRGGTIISTEDIFTYLAYALKPWRVLLAGDTAGVLDEADALVPRVTPDTLPALRRALGGSAQTDVTGGMEMKVTSMLELCRTIPGLTVRIFSGFEAGQIARALGDTSFDEGTLLTDGLMRGK